MMFLALLSLVPQVDPPPTGVTGSKGIFSSVGSSGLDSCSPNGLISTSAIFFSIY